MPQAKTGTPVVIRGEMWNTAPAYEYEVIVTTGQGHFEDVLDEINEMGSQGWRIAAVAGNYIFMERAKLDMPSEG